MHIGLSLIIVALESGASHIGHFASLLNIVKDDLCKNLFTVKKCFLCFYKFFACSAYIFFVMFNYFLSFGDFSKFLFLAPSVRYSYTVFIINACLFPFV